MLIAIAIVQLALTGLRNIIGQCHSTARKGHAIDTGRGHGFVQSCRHARPSNTRTNLPFTLTTIRSCPLN
jgi:hypothetical protein